MFTIYRILRKILLEKRLEITIKVKYVIITAIGSEDKQLSEKT